MKIYYVGNIPFGDELYHHGIKGQQWGVRRYQNEDGSLTPAGKERYGTVENFINQRKLEEARKTSGRETRRSLLAYFNPKNLVSEESRQKAREQFKKKKMADAELEKAQKEADKSKKTWKRELYKNEIDRGRKLAKSGYDATKDILRRDFLDAKYNEIVERQHDRIDRGERFSREYDTDETTLSLIKYEADAIDARLRDYRLYNKWGK